VAYQPLLLAASAARTTNGTSTIQLNADQGDNLSVALVVTAFGGTTPTLDVVLEWSMDNGVTWVRNDPTADAFTQVTGNASLVRTFPVRATTFRVAWTIGGTTPSFTFSVRAMMTN
jgi:hypothetical protein